VNYRVAVAATSLKRCEGARRTAAAAAAAAATTTSTYIQQVEIEAKITNSVFPPQRQQQQQLAFATTV
jgi:hypothetical protein